MTTVAIFNGLSGLLDTNNYGLSVSNNGKYGGAEHPSSSR